MRLSSIGNDESLPMAGRMATATTVVLRKRGNLIEVLLEKRGKPPRVGAWSIPGGHIKPGESPQQGAIRELYEETGIKVAYLEPMESELSAPDRAAKDFAFATIVDPRTEVKANGGAKSADEADAAALHWVDVGKIPQLAFGQQKLVYDAMSKLFGEQAAVQEAMAAVGRCWGQELLLEYDHNPYHGPGEQYKDVVRKIIQEKPSVNNGLLIVFEGIDGAGKCFGKDTPVLMYDGTIKPVQDVAVGDLVMGDDSTARTVTSLARGREQLYRIVPKKGDPYIVNESHILVLGFSGSAKLKTRRQPSANGDITQISVRDYLLQSRNFKKHTMGLRAGVRYRYRSVRIDPYLLGYWLGDGNSHDTGITSSDWPETLELVEQSARQRGLQVRVENKPSHRTLAFYQHGGQPGVYESNSLLNDLYYYDLIQNKHVPHQYLANSTRVRRAVLAGLLDSDGHNYKDRPGVMSFSNKNERLADGVVYLARSLGLAAYKRQVTKRSQYGTEGVYYTVSVFGDCHKLPLRLRRKQAARRTINKNPLHVGITVERLEVDNYFGFTVDGNHRFLLGDFTVTHNSLQVDALEKWLKELGYDVVISPWNSSEILRKATKKAKQQKVLTPILFCLLHAADLILRYDLDIKPALERNQIVICDRYVYTSIARDKIRGVDVSILDTIYENIRAPDILFHAAVPIHIAFARILKRKGFSYYGTGSDLHLADNYEDNYVKYERMLDDEYSRILPAQKNYHKLDMNQAPEQITADIRGIVAEVAGIGKYAMEQPNRPGDK